MKMTRLAALFLVALMLLSLMACAGSVENETRPQTGPDSGSVSESVADTDFFPDF